MTPEDWRFSSAADETATVRIALTHDAYAAIAATLPQGGDARAVEPAAAGKVLVWLDDTLAECLASLCRCGEDQSDVILRLAAIIDQAKCNKASSRRKGNPLLASA